MTAMTEFEVYRYYLALKLHFTTDGYDVIAQRGRVRASRAAFARRQDLMGIRRVARDYTDQEVANFLIANFVSGDRWGGMFDNQSSVRYQDWQRRQQALLAVFDRDLAQLDLKMQRVGQPFEHAWVVSSGRHPYIFKEYLSGNISIETLTIMERLLGFAARWDAALGDDVIWPDVARIMRKYQPFLNIEETRYRAVLTRRISDGSGSTADARGQHCHIAGQCGHTNRIAQGHAEISHESSNTASNNV